jgi:hypothetical protein
MRVLRIIMGVVGFPGALLLPAGRFDWLETWVLACFLRWKDHDGFGIDARRSSMDVRTRQYIHGLVFVLGLVLIVAGIATRLYGAWIVGLIVAAVNLRQWLAWRKKQPTGSKETPQG